jgi:hypothetical protein
MIEKGLYIFYKCVDDDDVCELMFKYRETHQLIQMFHIGRKLRCNERKDCYSMLFKRI